MKTPTVKICEKVAKKIFESSLLEFGWDIVGENEEYYFFSPSDELEPGDRWRCICGKEHSLGGYVAAHWNESLKHTCQCGIKRSLCNGVLTFLGKKK